MIFLIEPGISFFSNQFFQGFFLSLLIAIISLKVKFLKISGSLATFILAFLIFSFGGWQWTLSIFSFFVLSSVLSKIREKKNPAVNKYFQKSGSRDFFQVVANGGLGGVLVVINYFIPNQIWFSVYSGIIAAACADTWATEIGTLTRHKTYDILNFKKVEPGTSGGVSFAGFIGSLAGAFCISLIAAIWIDKQQIGFILLITFSGFAASALDSILGTTLQVQYKCLKCGRIIDNKIHCETTAEKIHGINFINNDFVNLVAGLTGGIIVFSLTGW